MSRSVRICMSAVVVALALTVVTSMVGLGVASGVVLEDKSPEQKHRKDIGKQISKAILCITKAATKCEANGVDSSQECDLVDPASSTVPDPKNKVVAKLSASLGKCQSKLNLTKKGPDSDYQLIGCPGDSDPDTPGDQPFASMAAFQANLSTAVRAQLSLLTPVIEFFCLQLAPGEVSPSTDPVVLDCAQSQASGLSAYAKGVFKCQEKCENDYKNKKGNGGGTDSTTQCAAGDAGADPALAACVTAALAKAEKKGALLDPLIDAINAAVNDASNDLYNEDDCGP